jgi:hypothetical protein
MTAPARGLPPACNLRRTAPGDAEHVAALLRSGDRLEMEALEGRPALNVLQGWMSGGAHVLAVHGEAAAIFGIVACDLVQPDQRAGGQRMATPWAAVVSTLGHEDLVDVLWLSRLQVDAWQRRWPVLQMVCDARNSFRGQWLDWLGFERRGRVERFGAAGLPFNFHVRLTRLDGGMPIANEPPPMSCLQ